MQKSARRTALAVVTAILFTSGGWLLAQQTQAPYGTPAVPPDIRTGGDLGFRVHGMKGWPCSWHLRHTDEERPVGRGGSGPDTGDGGPARKQVGARLDKMAGS
jgi:hypothetical protein